MFIARTDKFKYLGYKSIYHCFKDEQNNSLTLVPQAKLIDIESDVVFMLKEDGKVEASYASARNHTEEEIEKAYRALFSTSVNDGIVGQLSFDEQGNIIE